MANPQNFLPQPPAGAIAYLLPGETFLALEGADRAALLNNLCTNNIKTLAVGTGREAFLTNIQGKILAHLEVQARADSLLLHTVPGQAEKILAHLDRYIIREDVRLEDLTQQINLIYLAGAKADKTLAALGAAELPESLLAFCPAKVDGQEVTITQVDWTLGGGYRMDCAAEHFEAIMAALLAAGAERGTAEQFELARIQAGTPRYGQDITDENLAQEVGREGRTIDFNKGCYLGQETVARIDALGHVNRTLCRLRIGTSEPVAVGTELFAAEKPAGKITSAAFDPAQGAVVALGYVRRGHNQPGTILQCEAGTVSVLGD